CRSLSKSRQDVFSYSSYCYRVNFIGVTLRLLRFYPCTETSRLFSPPTDWVPPLRSLDVLQVPFLRWLRYRDVPCSRCVFPKGLPISYTIAGPGVSSPVPDCKRAWW